MVEKEAMTDNLKSKAQLVPKWMTTLPLILAAVGIAVFVLQLTAGSADRAWQAYLINFLLWAAIFRDIFVMKSCVSFKRYCS